MMYKILLWLLSDVLLAHVKEKTHTFSASNCLDYFIPVIVSISSKKTLRAFEQFFCLANAGFFTFSSKTRTIVPTSNLCRNFQRQKNQLNQYILETCITYLERTDKNTSTCTRKQCWNTLEHLQQPLKPKTCHISAIIVCICKWDWTDS